MASKVLAFPGVMQLEGRSKENMCELESMIFEFLFGPKEYHIRGNFRRCIRIRMMWAAKRLLLLYCLRSRKNSPPNGKEREPPGAAAAA